MACPPDEIGQPVGIDLGGARGAAGEDDFFSPTIVPLTAVPPAPTVSTPPFETVVELAIPWESTASVPPLETVVVETTPPKAASTVAPPPTAKPESVAPEPTSRVPPDETIVPHAWRR